MAGFGKNALVNLIEPVSDRNIVFMFSVSKALIAEVLYMIIDLSAGHVRIQDHQTNSKGVEIGRLECNMVAMSKVSLQSDRIVEIFVT